MIHSEHRDHVAHLQLDRPDAENRITMEMFAALGRAFAAADDDPEVRCVLVTAIGPDFCTGADRATVLPAWAIGRNPIDIAEVNPWGVVGRRRTRPLIVAVHGRCMNGGLELALAADICIAADTTRFAFQELRIGTYPFAGGVFR